MIRKFYMATNAGQIHGRRLGEGETPVVLLHRTPVTSAGFEPVMRMLARLGHASIALDTPGFGESFLPAGAPGASDYGAWLLEALDSAGVDRFHLAAHHTGTHFAAEIAARMPARVASLTLSGILLAPPEERPGLREDIGHAPAIDLAGAYIAETFRVMKSLYLDPVAELVHAETMGALQSGHGRDLAFDAIFAQDFAGVLKRAIGAGVPVQAVQAGDDPLTLNGMLTRFRERFPEVPVTMTGPAFLATPERQAGAFVRAIDQLIRNPTEMQNRRYELLRNDTGFALVRADGDVPTPGPGEVLVRVHAVSINRRDIGVRDLSYPVNGADRFVPLSDAAGVPGGDTFAHNHHLAGDRVASSFFQNHPAGRLTLPAVVSALGAGGPGVLADHVVLAESGLVAIPDGWTFAEAACLPCAGVTAWSALQTLGGLLPDDDVLVLGTGGVALFAVQIAAAAGARPIVLSSSDEKIERALALGAVAGINYRDCPDWADAVRKLTNGAGVQHVVELGGAGTLHNSIAALGIAGHLALIGALDGFGGEFSALPLIFAGLRISAVVVGSRADHQALSDFMVCHGLKPVIDSTFGFDQVEAAYARADAGAFGKVVVTL